jgi:hypothetical protein
MVSDGGIACNGDHSGQRAALIFNQNNQMRGGKRPGVVRRKGTGRWKGSMAERPRWSTRPTRAYAWSSPVEGSDRRRFYAMLHLGGIRSPLDAVRAAIVAEHRVKE